MARGNFGERLKRERELREVPMEEITLATRIGSRFLEALENEEWEKLPGGVFNRGFVRSIARYLGLDEEALLAEYDLAHSAHAQLLEQKHAAIKLENRIPPTPLWVPVAFVLAILLLLAAVVYGGMYSWRKYVRHSAAGRAPGMTVPAAGGSAKPMTSPSDGGSSLAVPAAAPAVPAEPPLDLSLSASTDTHVTVQADGTTIFDSVVHRGENLHFPAKTEFVVTAADSSTVLLELNGEAMPPAGAPGTSGTITLTRNNLRQASGGNPQP